MRSWATTKTKHGTVTGNALHRELGEPPCDACRQARRTYDDERGYRKGNRMRARASSLARTRLVQAFPVEYLVLYHEAVDELLQREAET